MVAPINLREKHIKLNFVLSIALSF